MTGDLPRVRSTGGPPPLDEPSPRVVRTMQQHRHGPDGKSTMSDIGGGETLETLDSDECLRLMATQDVGRLGVIAEHYPLIFPVNYALDHGVIVIRTSPGTKLTAADHANVTFEVDDIDTRGRSGWSVLVRGLAEEVGREHRDELVQRTKATGVTPWPPGEHEHWVRIIPHRITGRRITSREWPTSFGYL
jgi:nitroimidazol reductase NimA-like FMN-containing flavoprotein (pyridoxamine 5'-phosphate oxidase superfamily)